MSLTTLPSIAMVPAVISSRPAQHPQQRRLAAARRADEHHELAVLDVEADAVDDLGAAEGLLDVLERYRCHCLYLLESVIGDRGPADQISPRLRSVRRPCSA